MIGKTGFGHGRSFRVNGFQHPALPLHDCRIGSQVLPVITEPGADACGCSTDGNVHTRNRGTNRIGVQRLALFHGVEENFRTDIVDQTVP